MECKVKDVEGRYGRNWMLIKQGAAQGRLVIFFPGDLSNFAADVEGFPQYSWEAVLWTLCRKFPENDSWVVLVCPSKVEHHLAHYEHFLEVDGWGNPASAASTSLEQLYSLLEGSQEGAVDTWEQDCEITLCAFSKGGVVLSALLRDASTTENQQLQKFWKRVTTVHFLDCGLNVRNNFHLLTEEELHRLQSRCCHDKFRGILLHGSPRQMLDFKRPHKGAEFDLLYRNCIAAKFPCWRFMYELPATLDGHFQILEEFRVSAVESGSCGFDMDLEPEKMKELPRDFVQPQQGSETNDHDGDDEGA